MDIAGILPRSNAPWCALTSHAPTDAQVPPLTDQYGLVLEGLQRRPPALNVHRAGHRKPER